MRGTRLSPLGGKTFITTYRPSSIERKSYEAQAKLIDPRSQGAPDAQSRGCLKLMPWVVVSGFAWVVVLGFGAAVLCCLAVV